MRDWFRLQNLRLFSFSFYWFTVKLNQGQLIVSACAYACVGMVFGVELKRQRLTIVGVYGFCGCWDGYPGCCKTYNFRIGFMSINDLQLVHL